LLNTVPQIEHHLIDLCLQRVHLAACLDRDEASKVSVHCRCRDLSKATDLRGQVSGHRVDGHTAQLENDQYKSSIAMRMAYVISCHIPWTLPTSACTPNLPSVPTSLATFLTSAANIANWSIMSFMVL